MNVALASKSEDMDLASCSLGERSFVIVCEGRLLFETSDPNLFERTLKTWQAELPRLSHEQFANYPLQDPGSDGPYVRQVNLMRNR